LVKKKQYFGLKIEIIKSAFAAMFGVQSEAARKRDFESDSALPYIIAGFIAVILFLISVVVLVLVAINLV
tara:strand:- start:48 stop:257 length:210 start_codon:yes stop_codon:yes gene_type:complete